MTKYPKIATIFKRSHKTNELLEGEWSKSEFEYLKNNVWSGEEKLDGTNCRICYYSHPLMPDEQKLELKGRTDKADIPKHLLDYFNKKFNPQDFIDLFGVNEEGPDVALYAEGLSHKIQKGGKYFKKGKGYEFVLFDIKIGNWWLRREDIVKIANKLKIPVAPVRFEGKLANAISLVRKGITSEFGNKDFLAEGLVLKPKIELRNRMGRRIVAKLKTRDFHE